MNANGNQIRVVNVDVKTQSVLSLVKLQTHANKVLNWMVMVAVLVSAS